MRYNRAMSKTHRETLRHSLWTILVIGLGVLAAFLVTEAVAGASNLFEKIAYERVENTTYTKTEPEKKSYYLVGNAEEPTILAQAFLVADLKTGQILLSEGGKVVLPVASITKLVTAIVAQEEFEDDEIITITKEVLETEGWRGSFTEGEEIAVKELLYPLLMVSSNDAGEALAEHQNRNDFIAKMNDVADEIGLHHTRFNDPTGLSPLNTSTAEDLFILLQHMNENNRDILKITNKDYYSKEEQVWENKSKLRNEDTFVAGKTGFTNKAKRTSAGIYQIPLSGGETRTIGIVILKSESRETDIRSLINYLQKYVHFGTEQSLNNLAQN